MFPRFLMRSAFSFESIFSLEWIYSPAWASGKTSLAPKESCSILRDSLTWLTQLQWFLFFGIWHHEKSFKFSPRLLPTFFHMLSPCLFWMYSAMFCRISPYILGLGLVSGPRFLPDGSAPKFLFGLVSWPDISGSGILTRWKIGPPAALLDG